MTPTAEQVYRAYQRVPGIYGATIVRKGAGYGTVLSEVVGAGLESLGVMSLDAFLMDCATTLGPLVLVPYTPGTATESWGLVSQLSTLAHELEHVRQWRESQIIFPFAYLADSRERALYEVDAMRPGLLLRHRLAPLQGTAQEIAARYAERLRGYACDSGDRAHAASLLEPFVTAVLAGAETDRRYPQVGEILEAMGDDS